MLISLSSHNETDPARFQNSLHAPVVIKKFSYICLVQAQIIRDKIVKVVSIPPNTIFNVRVDAYNCFQLIINNGGTGNLSLTPTQLVAQLNTARNANPLLRQSDSYFEFLVSDDNIDYAFELVFYNDINFDQNTTTLKNYIYGNDLYFRQQWNLIQNYTDTVPSSQNGANRTQIPTVLSRWGLGIAWDEAYYSPPDNQINRNATNMLLSPNPILDSIQTDTLTITNINLNDVTLTIGPAICNDAVPPIYTDVSLPTYNNYVNRKFELDFVQDIGLRVYVKNNQTDTMEEVVTSNVYSYGDELTLALNVDGGTAPVGVENLAYPVLNHKLNFGGLMFMYVGKMGDIANRPAGANYLLVPTTTENNNWTISSNMSYVYDSFEQSLLYDSPTDTLYNYLFNGNDSSNWKGNTAFGSGAGIGIRQNTQFPDFIGTNPGWIYDQTLGRPGSFPFLNSGETQVPNAQFRNATGCWGFNTFADGIARVGTQVEIPNVYRMFPTTAPLKFNGPTYVCTHMMFGNTTGMYDAGDINDSHRVIFAHNQTPTVTVALNQTEAWDVRVMVELTSDNLPTTTEEFILEDNASNRIDMTLSENGGTDSYNYTFHIAYFGKIATGPDVYQYQILCNEQVRTAGGGFTNTLFFSAIRNIAGGYARIAPINFMGGCDPTNSAFIGGGGGLQYRYYNMSPLTFFSNLRVYQKTHHTTNTANIWNGVNDSISEAFDKSFTNNDGLLPSPLPTTDFYPNFRTQQLFPTGAQQQVIERYQNMPYNDPQDSNTLVVAKTTVTNPITGYNMPNQGWFDLSNIYIQSDIRTPLTGATKNLNASSQNGKEQGIVEATILDTIIEFESPANPDANENFMLNPGFRLGQGVAFPTSRITMDFDNADIPSEKLKIQIPNLPHNSYNGNTKTADKTIYEIPYGGDKVTIENDHAIVEVEPPSKVWIPLNNAGEIPINHFDVRIADVNNNEASFLSKDTNIVIQIEDNINLLN